MSASVELGKKRQERGKLETYGGTEGRASGVGGEGEGREME